jgi:hypothetical protein
MSPRARVLWIVGMIVFYFGFVFFRATVLDGRDSGGGVQTVFVVAGVWTVLFGLYFSGRWIKRKVW